MQEASCYTLQITAKGAGFDSVKHQLTAAEPVGSAVYASLHRCSHGILFPDTSQIANVTYVVDPAAPILSGLRKAACRASAVIRCPAWQSDHDPKFMSMAGTGTLHGLPGGASWPAFLDAGLAVLMPSSPAYRYWRHTSHVQAQHMLTSARLSVAVTRKHVTPAKIDPVKVSLSPGLHTVQATVSFKDPAWKQLVLVGCASHMASARCTPAGGLLGSPPETSARDSASFFFTQAVHRGGHSTGAASASVTVHQSVSESEGEKGRLSTRSRLLHM